MNRIQIALAALVILASAAAAEEPLTSDAVLRRACDVIRAARTSYEESDYEMTFSAGGDSLTRTASVILAVSRPSRLRVTVSGSKSITAVFDGKELLMYNAATNQYARRAVTDPAKLRRVLALVGYDIPTIEMYLSDDPYKTVTADAVEISELRSEQVGDRDVWRVDIKQRSGAVAENYFDKKDFRLVRLAISQPLNPETGMAAARMSLTVKKSVVDTPPRDAEGREFDPLDFSLPKGATKSPKSRQGEGELI